jgi:serine/threonine protein kinase
MYQICIVGGPEKGRVFPLADGKALTIGRGQQSDTQINDPFLSRLHCNVCLKGSVVKLVHTGSSPTNVRGEAVIECQLKDGDEFQAGSSTFRFVVGDISSDATIRVPVSASDGTAPLPCSDLKAPAVKDLVGHTLGQYRLDKIIAAGSSGLVFKATDTEKNRVAAIKVLSPDRTSTDEERERFVRAMKTMLPIKHPNIVALWNAGKNGPFCWAAMEYVDCESLTEVIQRIGVEGMLDWKDVWQVGMHIGRALEKAYEEKVIHRNVTPSNILRRKSDKVCLLGDLMLAKALEGALSKQVTSAGRIVGDIPYMPPERTFDDASVDTRSDIYGLGATMYALLAGRPPFESNSMAGLIKMIREQEPVPPKKYQLSINELFETVVLKMISKLPDHRYATPTALLAELERVGRYSGLKVR